MLFTAMEQQWVVYGSSESTLSNADNDKAVEMVVQSEDEGLLIYQIN